MPSRGIRQSSAGLVELGTWSFHTNTRFRYAAKHTEHAHAIAKQIPNIQVVVCRPEALVRLLSEDDRSCAARVQCGVCGGRRALEQLRYCEV